MDGARRRLGSGSSRGAGPDDVWGVARLLLIALIACLTQGCFVWEELEKGEAIMDAHRPRNLDDPKEPAAVAPDEDESNLIASLSQTLNEWWTSATEPSAPERDPGDVPVRCEINGRMQFTRKSDCSLRGGSIR